MSVVLFTGIRSFFVTDHRPLAYGAGAALPMLGHRQRRFVHELLHGGPFVQFGAGRTPQLGVTCSRP